MDVRRKIKEETEEFVEIVAIRNIDWELRNSIENQTYIGPLRSFDSEIYFDIRPLERGISLMVEEQCKIS